MSSPVTRFAGWRPHLLRAAILAAVAFWIYSPVFHGDWLWDDSVLITANPLMNDPDGLRKIWFQPGVLIDYFPITFTVQRLEWDLWGTDTLGYHLINIVLHLVSAFLVWRLLGKLGLRMAWWGGLLFIVHPVMVESVAWIAELKNTLSLPPLLLAMCFWIDYDERGSLRDYRQALVLFLVAMLCKSSEMMFPTVVLLYAWWKRGRIGWADLKASAPFFAVALLLGAFGAWLEHHHPGPPDYVAVTWLARIATVGQQAVFLLLLGVFPLHLLPIYPSGLVGTPTAADILPWVSLAALLTVAWLNRGAWGRHLILGLGFFLLNLVPVMGYILMSAPNMVWSLDHLLYLPILGLIGLVVGGLGWLDRSLPRAARLFAIGTAAVLTALLTCESHAYAGMFRDSETLWTYAWQRNPGSWLVRSNLGAALTDRGRLAEAVVQDEAAIKMNPLYDAVHYNLGNTLGRMGRDAEAIQEYKVMVRLNPGFAPAYEQMGSLLARNHRNPEAIDSYEKAVRLNPQLASAHFYLGGLLVDADRLPEAIDQFGQSLQVDPNHAEVHSALGDALLRTNQFPEAAGELQQALQLNPNDVTSRGNFGVALVRMGRVPEAQEQLEAAVRMDPKDFGAHDNLAGLYLTTGQIPQAIAEYQAALRIQPDFVPAQKNLARAQAMQQAQGARAPAR